MEASEIRRNGIQAPPYAFSGGREQGTDFAVAENLGIIAGILLELAAQGAERNEMLRELNKMQRELNENRLKALAATNQLRDTLESVKKEFGIEENR